MVSGKWRVDLWKVGAEGRRWHERGEKAVGGGDRMLEAVQYHQDSRGGQEEIEIINLDEAPKDDMMK